MQGLRGLTLYPRPRAATSRSTHPAKAWVPKSGAGAGLGPGQTGLPSAATDGCAAANARLPQVVCWTGSRACPARTSSERSITGQVVPRRPSSVSTVSGALPSFHPGFFAARVRWGSAMRCDLKAGAPMWRVLRRRMRTPTPQPGGASAPVPLPRVPGRGFPAAAGDRWRGGPGPW